LCVRTNEELDGPYNNPIVESIKLRPVPENVLSKWQLTTMA